MRAISIQCATIILQSWWTPQRPPGHHCGPCLPSTSLICDEHQFLLLHDRVLDFLTSHPLKQTLMLTIQSCTFTGWFPNISSTDRSKAPPPDPCAIISPTFAISERIDPYYWCSCSCRKFCTPLS